METDEITIDHFLGNAFVRITHTHTQPDNFDSDQMPIVIHLDLPSSSVFGRCPWSTWIAIDREMNEMFKNTEIYLTNNITICFVLL